ncbi:Rieske 2Fe-2S domain-containing protein [Variovorax sp. LT1R16]|uniref:Rieske 2Fe-2S domain-containing protein n=1 Tax=Variovorax sp. LT1R16 TaxID=3443728 RepID=UPI003F457908
MLSRKDNETMCRVGPGTPMGDALRRYWVPVLSSYQLPPAPGGDPVKVEVFGERYVAFRDGTGKVGLLDENCPHRSASLALGRVEADGIRCLFHGWKFSVSGTVVETPTVSDPRFCSRFKARAFPVREAGGMIWAYLGPAELEPEFPHWHYFDQPPERLLTVTFVVPCNFVQVQEALLDSAHLTVLHQDAFKRKSDIDFAATVSTVTAAADPKIEVEDTSFGFHYVAMRPAPGGPEAGTVARVTSYVAPFHVLNANGDFVGMIVPIDDHRTLHHFVWWSGEKNIAHEPHRGEQLRFVGLDEDTQHKAGLHYDTWHLPGKPNRLNNFLQDRDAMRNGAYSGLPIFFPEDSAMLVSAGEIRDRSKEMLSPGDVAIVRLYKTLLGVARQVQEGREPVGLRIDPRRIHGRNGVIKDGQPWQSLVPEHQRVHAGQAATEA